MGKNQHVVPVGSKWGVRGEGNARLTAIYETQYKAEMKAKEIARNQHSECLIHGMNGRIREKNSYGNDPYPPKG